MKRENPTVDNLSTDAPRRAPNLRREVVLPTSHGGQIGLLVLLLCTLSGLSVGVGLKAVTASVAQEALLTDASRPRHTLPPCSPGCTWLGVQVIDADGEARVVAVFDETPAARAGVRVGDTIDTVAGYQIRSAAAVVAAVRSFAPGTVVTVTGRRYARCDSTRFSVDVELGAISAGRLSELRRP